VCHFSAQKVMVIALRSAVGDYVYSLHSRNMINILNPRTDGKAYTVVRLITNDCTRYDKKCELMLVRRATASV